MTLIVISLGAFFLCELAKTLIPWPMQPWTKTVAVLAAALALSAWLSNGVLEMTTTALAASGLALIAHRVHRFLGAAGDAAQVDVVVKTTGGRPRR